MGFGSLCSHVEYLSKDQFGLSISLFKKGKKSQKQNQFDLEVIKLTSDELNENIIPQINLYSLLSKSNGEAEREYNTYNENFIRKFEITCLPPYIILYIVRLDRSSQAIHIKKSN